MMWTEMLKKVASTSTTSAQPHTPTDKTPEKETNKDNVELSELSQWTPSFVEEIIKTADKTTTPPTQLVEVVEQPPLVVTPISQKTAEEYEFSIRREQVIHELDQGKWNLRLQRQTELTETLKSPYMKRAVDLTSKLDIAEVSVSSYMFSAWGSPWDTMFKTTKCVTVMRSTLESLFPGMELHILVISAWADLLNYEERFRQKGTITRLFCSVNMLNEKDYKKSAKIRSRTFAENMDSVLLSAEVKNIRDKSLIFVPVLHDDHFYCVCFNLRDNKVEVLDNSAKDVSMK
ncbi:putative papain-like cysteine peptidase superfamily [Helianthus annuus]|uniref:Papain-like cysteine peptidase superfamily n=1 Tax=Helianthus annuus TaxID=4232 RepID=A0A9K3P0L3_HELAN|nr:putative papain-like cysteine peptidase superfamily [Helianthus annuus]KAJ0615923.1 putative papain-like cysteine peptidase superfamily [Helianthus annuus]